MKRISRLDFIRQAATAIAGAALHVKAEAADTRSEERVLAYQEAFPMRVPGARRVAFVEAANPGYCLIHVRQYHGAAERGFEPRVAESQADVKRILEYLLAHHPPDRFYIEGVERDDEKNALKDIERVVKRRDTSAPVFGSDCVGAAEHLWLEGRIAVRGAEPKGYYADIIPEYGRLYGDQAKESARGIARLHDFREDLLLERMCSDTPRINCVIQGAAHDYRDNLLNWNTRNPRRRISLVEITPTHL